MALTFQGNSPFSQRDVRETPASTATATAVGLTGESYVLVGAGGADLTAERTLTAGTGVSVTDAGAGTTVTLATIDGDIVHDNLSGFVANEHLDWTTDRGATNIHANNYTDTDTTYTAGEGLDLAGGVFSGEDATTANKGIASFNTNDFTVAAGAVSLKNKTSYASTAVNPTSENFAPVQLPNGAVVTAAIAYGSDPGSGTWTLYRRTLSGGANTSMATAAINTADTSISNATIDNSTYSYMVEIDSGDFYGIRITYTTDYI